MNKTQRLGTMSLPGAPLPVVANRLPYCHCEEPSLPVVARSRRRRSNLGGFEFSTFEI